MRGGQERDPADLFEVHPDGVRGWTLEQLLSTAERADGLDPTLLVLPPDVDDLDAFVREDLLHVCEELLDLLGGDLHLGQAIEHILRGDEPSLTAPGRERLRRFVPGFVEVEAVDWQRLGRGIGGELRGGETCGVPHESHQCPITEASAGPHLLNEV